ncbi:MAG TPA: hypothetical protein VK698_13610 [Kofleriaceae bacterium]|nr:hypothetical protein [Kofleriaceae bacterium]
MRLALPRVTLSIASLLAGAGCGDNAARPGDAGGGTVEDAAPAPGADAASPADAGDDPADAAVAELAPWIEPVEPTTLPVPTAVGLPPVSGFSINARIQPRGLPATWRVEYGRTADHGESSAERALPGQLTAHFAEDWAAGRSGWLAGIRGGQLRAEATGGPDGGPFVRYVDDQGGGDDVNHYDGIGLIHLGPYFYPGNYVWAEIPPFYLGGGFPDLRGARISMDLRGVDWRPNGTEIGTWIQAYRDPSVVEVVPEDSRYPNWAFTGDPQTRHLASGEWERADWVLRDRTQDWTFAGANGGRLLYDYGELDALLGKVNVDFFLLQILHVDLGNQPRGGIDSANLDLTYRQHSLCAVSNGATLAREPTGGTGAELLADGWRNGPGREWQSQPRPTGPQVFEYAFERPVMLASVNVHNAIANPSREVEVAVSSDEGATWTTVTSGIIPKVGGRGPNHALLHTDAYILVDGVAVWSHLHPDPVDRLRVTIVSAHQPDRWGLGEIEAFGTGAAERTDDDWYDLSQDIRVDPGEWHFRVAATTSAGTTYGPDQVVDVPE